MEEPRISVIDLVMTVCLQIKTWMFVTIQVMRHTSIDSVPHVLW